MSVIYAIKIEVDPDDETTWDEWYTDRHMPDLVAQSPQDVSQPIPGSLHELSEEFRRARAELIAQLRGLPPALWTRVGRHSEFGPVTLQQQATYFAKHEQWHMAQMTRIRRAIG